MPERTTYEIVIRGRASGRILRPLLDDFTVDQSDEGTTRLVGEVTDATHLHGLYAHLMSMNADVVSIAPLTASPPHQPGSTQP